MAKTFRMGELFSGPGGIAYGAKTAASEDKNLLIEHKWASDFDRDTCDTYALIAEDLVKANVTFVEAMRRQLFLYQYPSAVFVESETEKYSGIIDNKAYENGYSITGDHKRRMMDEYIPNVKKYANAKYPLAFFNYISTNFGKNINEQLREITNETKINGSAIPVEILIDLFGN